MSRSRPRKHTVARPLLAEPLKAAQRAVRDGRALDREIQQRHAARDIAPDPEPTGRYTP